MAKMLVLTAVALAGIGTPTLARDTTGYHAIAAGNLSLAEDRLNAERRIYRDRPELLLNLAAVYERTGRAAEARTLYRGVLDQPAVMMEMPSGATMSSHAIATAGLTLAARDQVVSR